MQKITLINRREVAPALFELCFTRPDNWGYDAGQFARIGMTLEEGDVFRAYSIASAPESSTLDFLVKSVTDGALSPKLCALNPGDTVMLDGDAQGNLLPARIAGNSDVWMMATGSGLAPFLSMLADPKALAMFSRRLLVIGARTRAETDQLAAYAREKAKVDVEILPVASREEGPLTGRLPTLIESGALEAAAHTTFTPDQSRILLCGNPDFIRATRAIFKAKGIVSPRLGKPGQLLVESLW